MSRAPAFYGSLLLCMISQSLLFWEVAPAIFSLVLPGLVSAFAATRLLWCLTGRHGTRSEASAEADLRRSIVFIGSLVATILVIDVALLQYANGTTALYLLFTLLTWCLVGAYCTFFIEKAGVAIMSMPVIVLVFALPVIDAVVAPSVTLVVLGITAAAGFAMTRHYRDFISLIEARTQAQKLSDDNFRLASIDALTNLAGRRRFFAELERLAPAAARAGRRLAVAIADLDRFKPINDKHGHHVGDQVLQAVATRLGEGTGAFRHAYRLGGDEFALLSADAPDDERLIAEANTLIASVSRPIDLGDICVATGCSVGIAVAVDTPSTTTALYERADYALYNAKRSGRNRALLFSDEHESSIRSQASIEQELRNADLEGEFYLTYQPIACAASGAILGFECLAGWRSPVLGEVSPSIFMPIAEQSGLIANLTPILLRKALSEAAAWPKELRVSFNLSPLDIVSHEQVLAIVAIIGRSDIRPQRIDFELTESALLSSFDHARENMSLLKGIGAQIALDDFGTGYSSLSHLHALPLDKVKIARTFVRDLERDASSRTIVRSMLNLCRDLGLACVVEGVETPEQLQMLRELGCDLIQGYLVARPMEAAQVGRFLDKAALAA